MRPALHRGRGSVVLGAVCALSLGTAGGALVARLSAAQELAPPADAASFVARAATPPAPPARLEPTVAPEPALRDACGRGGGRIVRWRASVERGLDTSRRGFADGVRDVLCDRRGWTASKDVRFRYDPDAPLLIALRSAASTERKCLRLIGLSVHRTYSCASAREVVLNADRWFGGSETWPGSVRLYRALLVNHEVGHVLGLRHRRCGAPGARAPAMMQQSKGLGGCRANAWPLRSELRLVG